MNAFTIGEMVGAFAVSLGIAVIWLLIAYAIPPLRRRPHTTYVVAMVLAGLIQLVSLGGPSGANVGAAILCIALLYWQMRRAQQKQTSAADSK